MAGPFERYHCQMALPAFGEQAQRRLRNARVLIVGMGGLGCPVAQYLAAAGVGTMGIADDDMVSLRNLHRQILYTPDDVGLLKVNTAAKRLKAQNPSVDVIPYPMRVTSSNVGDLVAGFDLILEGTDNFETKYLLNDACVLAGKPLIYGAIYQYEGQVGVWNVLQTDGSYSPNYRDVFPNADEAQVPNCAEGGVIPTLAGMVGCMQANEAIKYLTQASDLLVGKLWMIDMRDGSTRTVNLKKSTFNPISKLAETVPTVPYDWLANEMKTGGRVLVIDVRTAAEHKIFNIGGENIPLDELEDNLERLTSAGKVICYCASGVRSATAARIIKRKFPSRSVYSLKGGINRPL